MARGGRYAELSRRHGARRACGTQSKKRRGGPGAGVTEGLALGRTAAAAEQRGNHVAELGESDVGSWLYLPPMMRMMSCGSECPVKGYLRAQTSYAAHPGTTGLP